MKAKFVLNSLKSDRRELDVNLLLVSGIGLGITSHFRSAISA
ncbi:MULTISPECIES: hypothetical protein [unclassified Microcystis]|nr:MULTISPECIES: hypothetical protein [unclassified Microcystis]MCZ8046879.1 hypothetical protein [Microcystis sp. LE19-41.2A]